jgi:acyl-CoA dehydrogenase
MGLLTPVIKGVLTDKGFDHAVMAQQMYGGHGYIEEWGMSQYVRDARIAMIYEGANGIQALDLVGRKLPAKRRPRRDGLLQGSRRFLRGKPQQRELTLLHQASEEGSQRPAGFHHVVRAERDGEARQCRCRQPPTTCISSASSRSATCGRCRPRPRTLKNAAGADGEEEFLESSCSSASYFMERVMPETAAQGPHRNRRRLDDGAGREDAFLITALPPVSPDCDATGAHIICEHGGLNSGGTNGEQSG